MKKDSLPYIGTWTYTPEDAYIYNIKSESVYKLNLKKCIPDSYDKLIKSESKNLINSLETFIVRRTAYENQGELICKYINYFIEFYDKKKELPLFYLIVKEKLDNAPTCMTIIEFATLVSRELFKKTKIKKLVYDFVEDNYNTDITIDEKTGRRFISEDDFTNNDAKKLFAISTIIKILIPVIDHYTNMSTVLYPSTADKDMNSISIIKDVFYTVANYKFKDMIAEDTETGDQLMAKLYKYTASSVIKHNKDNSRLWEHQAGLKSVTLNSKLDETIAANLFKDTLFKFKFESEGTIIGYIKSSINSHLKSTIKQYKYGYNPIHIDLSDSDDNSEDGSAMDKLEQTLSKIDETIIVKTDKIIDDFMNSITGKYDIPVEEINFYMEELSEPSEFHNKLLNYYWAKYFHSFTELKNMSSEKRSILLIVAKRQLFDKGFKELPYLLSSKNKGRTTSRMLRNKRFISKLEQSETYNRIISKKYSVISSARKKILEMISFVLNNDYIYVEYDSELNGQDIIFNEDIISDELLMFIDAI